MARATPSVEQLYGFVDSLGGRTLRTRSRGVPFTVERVGDRLVFVPSTTMGPRPQSRATTERFLDHFERTASMKTADYQKLTVNASYLLSLLDTYSTPV